MKHTFIAFILCMVSTCAFSQTIYTRWFDNLDEAKLNGYTYTIYRTTLFPDSTVQALYGDGNGGTVLQYVNTHGIGEVFDPKSSIYNNPIQQYNPYTVDSIAFGYQYNYVYEPGAAPDTLIIQFYTRASGGIDTSKNTDNTFVKYDPAQNLGLKEIGHIAYILSQSDQTNGQNQLLEIPTFFGPYGIQLPPNDLLGFTVSYRPGFTYQPGDTIDEYAYPGPLHPHSQFEVIVGNGNSTANYEQSLTVTKQVRYNQLPGWNGYYIPGTAWKGFDQVLWAEYHVIVQAIANDAGLNGYSGILNPHLHSTICNQDRVPVKVYLSNYWGSASLTSATISWTANGIRQPDYHWTGTILPGTEDTVTIGSFLVHGGSDTLRSWVQSPNGVKDSLPTNDSANMIVYVYPTPDAHFTYSEIAPALYTFTPQDGSLQSYVWSFGDSSSPTGAYTPTHQYVHQGTYTVTLGVVSQQGCSAIHDSSLVVESSGIPTTALPLPDVQIFPNPCTGTFSMEYELHNPSPVTITLYSPLGTKVAVLANEQRCAGHHQYAVSALSHLSPGLYFLQLSTDSGTITKQILKK